MRTNDEERMTNAEGMTKDEAVRADVPPAPEAPARQDGKPKTYFAVSDAVDYIRYMSAAELIEQFKALPPNERAQVAKFVVENDDSWIPESLREGMADAESGRVVDLDTALNEPYPGDK